MSSRLQAWIEHYRLMGEGKIHPNASGFFIVNMKKETNNVKPEALKLVTQTQQAVEMAASDVRDSIRGGRKRRKKDMLFD